MVSRKSLSVELCTCQLLPITSHSSLRSCFCSGVSDSWKAVAENGMEFSFCTPNTFVGFVDEEMKPEDAESFNFFAAGSADVVFPCEPENISPRVSCRFTPLVTAVEVSPSRALVTRVVWTSSRYTVSSLVIVTY